MKTKRNVKNVIKRISHLGCMVIFYFISISNYSSAQETAYTAVWSKEDAVSGLDVGNDVVVDGNGDVYTIGYFSGSNVDFDPHPTQTDINSSSGGIDVYIQKLSSTGTLLWVKTFGGVNDDAGVGLSLNAAGELYATANYRGSVTIDMQSGTQSLTSAGDVDFVVMLLDSATGNAHWVSSFGDTGTDYSSAIYADDYNGVYTVGVFSNTVSFTTGSPIASSGGRDFFILKLTGSDGGFRWVQNHGSTHTTETANAVTVDSTTTEVIIGGTYFGTVDFDAGTGVASESSTWGRECFALKLDSAGGFVWVRSFDGNGNENMRAVTTDANSNVYLTGNYTNIFDADPDPDDPANEVQLNGGLSTQVFLVKLDGTGDYQWEYHTDGDDTNIPIDLFYNESNDVISTVGYFKGTTDFNPGPGQSVAAINTQSLFVVNVLEQGTTNRQFESVHITGQAKANAVHVDDDFSLYLAGEFWGTMDFDFGEAREHERSSAGNYDAFVVKYDTCTSTTTTQTIVTCDSLKWIDDSTYTSSTTTPRVVLEGANGCDSIILLDLTILASSESSASTTTTDYTAVWSKEDAVSGLDVGNDVVVDGNGDVYTIGYFSGSNVDFDPHPTQTDINSSSGGIDVYIQKLSSTGTLLWVKTFGGVNDDAGVGLSLNAAGELYATANYRGSVTIDMQSGTQSLTSAGDVDFVVMLLDSATGNAHWVSSFGDTGTDYSSAIYADDYNGVYTVGVFSNTVSFTTGSPIASSGGRDFFILKLTGSDGGFRWVQNHGSTHTTETANAVTVDSTTTEVIIGGTYFGTVDFDAGTGVASESSTWGRECFALKLDSAGGFVWVRSFDGNGNENMRAVTTDANSNVYLTGNYTNIFDADPDPDDPANEVQLNGGLSTQVFLVKLDGTGDYQWEYHTDGDDTNIPIDLFYNESNDVISTVGYFKGTTDFNPGPGQSVAAINTQSLFVVNVLEQGTTNRQFESVHITGQAKANAVHVDDDFSLYLAGEFWGTMDFDFGEAREHERSSAGNYDAFVVKYDTCTSTTTTQTIVTCDSLKWIDDSTYTSSTTTPRVVLEGANGCDSIVLLDLTVTSSVESSQIGFEGKYSDSKGDQVDQNDQILANEMVEDLGLGEAVKVYPNPTQGEVFIEIGEIEVLSLRVFDLRGHLLMENNIVEEKTIYELPSDLPEGILIISVLTEKENKTYRLIKQ